MTTPMISEWKKNIKYRTLKEDFIIESLGDISKEFDYMKYHCLQCRENQKVKNDAFCDYRLPGLKNPVLYFRKWALEKK